MNENTIRLLKNASSVLIAIGKQAKRDGFAAALALYVSLTQEGKSVHLCTEADVAQAEGLIGSDKIERTLALGGNVLKVSFPYSDGAIDKVTYNITDDRFNLLVEPHQGQTALDSKNVHFTYTGGAVDVIVCIEAQTLESLGNIYMENPDIFDQQKIINIDRRFDNKNFGAENIVEKQYSSTSEIVYDILTLMRTTISADAATNLYAGTAVATNNFSSFSTNAHTFETVSSLLKLGARKPAPVRDRAQSSFGVGPSAFQFNQRPPQPFAPMRPQQPIPTAPTQQMGQQPQPVQQVQPSGVVAQSPVMDLPENPPLPVNKKPPIDWLKPKIFKSSDTKSI
ncbi:MAG: hypothetical protein NUV65_04100 [Candidatus Roizmanbacteria bacterium]|nr:hypothetical protein [Candidatus Roizmanbacteria bacterium]